MNISIEKIEKYYLEQLALKDQEIAALKNNQKCTCGTIPDEIPSDYDFEPLDFSISKDEE
jgi:hypothetical protein